MRLPLVALLAVAAVSVPAQFPGSEPVSESLKTGFDRVSEAEAKRILTLLASDEFEGRGTGQPGFQKAAAFMATEFKKLGLKPMGDLGYFQNVRFAETRVDQANSSIRVLGGERIGVGSDFGWTVSGDCDFEAPLVLVKARGAAAKVTDPNAVRGAIVVLSGQGADPGLPTALLNEGAAAVVEIATPPSHPEWWVRPASWGAVPQGARLGRISAAAARRLLADADLPSGVEDTSPLRDGECRVAPSSKTARVQVKMENKDVPVPNVIGMLEGSDPKLRNQVVVVSAHLDHLGKQGGVIYHGADDDGSGSTAMLLVAQAMAAQKVKPKRSVLFIAFCGEEMGLVGSAYYVEHPAVPLADTFADLQIDMVGRNAQTDHEKPQDNTDTLRLIGSERVSKAMRQEVERANRMLHFRFLYDLESLYANSDQKSFGDRGIPVAFLFDGFHPDLHQPTDTVDKINWRKLVSAAKLYYLVGTDLANRTSPLKM